MLSNPFHSHVLHPHPPIPSRRYEGLRFILLPGQASILEKGKKSQLGAAVPISLKYLDNDVSILKSGSKLMQITAAEVTVSTRHSPNSAIWQQWPVFLVKQPLMI